MSAVPPPCVTSEEIISGIGAEGGSGEGGVSNAGDVSNAGAVGADAGAGAGTEGEGEGAAPMPDAVAFNALKAVHSADIDCMVIDWTGAEPLAALKYHVGDVMYNVCIHPCPVHLLSHTSPLLSSCAPLVSSPLVHLSSLLLSHTPLSSPLLTHSPITHLSPLGECRYRGHGAECHSSQRLGG